MGTNSSHSLGANVVKIFSVSDERQNLISLGYNKYNTDSYQQNQYRFGFKTVNGEGVYSEVNLNIGQAVGNEFVTRFGSSIYLSKKIEETLLDVSLYYGRGEGLLLGEKRVDNTISTSVSVSILDGVRLIAGYTSVDSTIDFFDVSDPSISLAFDVTMF